MRVAFGSSCRRVVIKPIGKEIAGRVWDLSAGAGRVGDRRSDLFLRDTHTSGSGPRPRARACEHESVVGARRRRHLALNTQTTFQHGVRRFFALEASGEAIRTSAWAHGIGKWRQWPLPIARIENRGAPVAITCESTSNYITPLCLSTSISTSTSISHESLQCLCFESFLKSLSSRKLCSTIGTLPELLGYGVVRRPAGAVPLTGCARGG